MAKKKQIQVGLDSDVLAWVTERAEKKGVSRATIVRWALAYYIESWRPEAKKGES